MQRFKGFVSSGKKEKEITVRLKKGAHPDHPLNGHDIPVPTREIPAGLVLKKYDNVTFTISMGAKSIGTAHDVLPEIEVSKGRK